MPDRNKERQILRFRILALIAILIIAAALRLNHIRQPFVDAFSWRQSDMAMMADNFYRGNWNIFYPKVNGNGPGPSYQGWEFQTVTYLSAMLYTIFGQQEWVGRAMAVLFGLWGIFALYQLVRRIWDEEYALVSAAVMAVMPGSIFIERSFLPDPAMVALVTTSLWFLVAYLQTDRLFYLSLACVFGAWGFLTKITGLIIGLPMLYAVFTILDPKHALLKRRLIIIGTAAAFTIAPVIVYYLWARHISLMYPPYHFAGAGNWLWDSGMQNWLERYYFFPRLSQSIRNWIWTPAIIMLVLFGLVFSLLNITSGRASANNLSKKAFLLFHWWFLGGIIFYVVGAKEIVENPWNFHIMNPAAAALAGYATITAANIMSRISRFHITSAVITVILILIGAFGQLGLKYMYHSYAYESYKLGLALRQVSEPEDLVVTVSNTFAEPTAIYYSQRRGWVFPPAFTWHEELLREDHEAIRVFEELRSNGADWLGIVNESFHKLGKNNPLLIHHIINTCELVGATPEWIIYRIGQTGRSAKQKNR
jgi:4-amino-4-deoxy-L-arabinose transferase-like glycosyltransferase